MQIKLTSYDELPGYTQAHFDVLDAPGALVVVRLPTMKPEAHAPVGTVFYMDLEPAVQSAPPSAPPAGGPQTTDQDQHSG